MQITHRDSRVWLAERHWEILLASDTLLSNEKKFCTETLKKHRSALFPRVFFLFQKAEIALADAARAIWAFWKRKNTRGKSAGRCFLKPFFGIRQNFFQSFRTKFLSLLYIRSLEYKISHCLSANQNSELRCVICTGVTLFALVLHLNWTALSQSESSNFFMCIIK